MSMGLERRIWKDIRSLTDQDGFDPRVILPLRMHRLRITKYKTFISVKNAGDDVKYFLKCCQIDIFTPIKIIMPCDS